MATSDIFQRVVATVLLLLASFALGADDTNAPVAKPVVKVGDRWTYRSMDYWTNRTVSTIESRVVFVGSDEISMTDTVKGSARTTDSFYKSDWATLTSSDGIVYDPPFHLLKFPLQVGATYEATWDAIATKKETLPGGGQAAFNYRPGISRSEATVKVVGWEDVVVPAGKFRALKLVATGSYTRLDIRCSGLELWQVWYVPEVKRWVKLTSDSGIDYECIAAAYRVIARDGFELVEFSVQ